MQPPSHLQAVVHFNPQLTGPRTLIKIVEECGFEASLWQQGAAGSGSNSVGPGKGGSAAGVELHRREAAKWRLLLVLSAVLTAPIVVVSMVFMIPALEM